MELDHTHPSAAASLREGMDETLTVLALGKHPTLKRTLRSTNAIESMIDIGRDHAGNVKRWRDQDMALRAVDPGFHIRWSRSVEGCLLDGHVGVEVASVLWVSACPSHSAVTATSRSLFVTCHLAAMLTFPSL